MGCSYLHSKETLMWLFEWLFSEKVPVNFSAALLIDMQEEFVDKIDKERRVALIKAQIAVIRYCAVKDIPVVVLEYLGQGATIEELRKEIDKVPRVAVVVRNEYDGFYRTELERTLDIFGAVNTLFMGINASCCVRQTAESALQKKYCVITSTDLIADGSNVIGDINSTERWFKNKCVLLPNSAMLFATHA